MSLSAYSSSYTSTANRRETKISEKRTEMYAYERNRLIDDVLEDDVMVKNLEDLTDQTNLDSAALRKMKNRDAAMRSR